MKQLFTQHPHISEGKITLKKIEKQDTEGLRQLISNPCVYRYLPKFIWENNKTNPMYLIAETHEAILIDNKSLILGIYYENTFCGIAEMYDYNSELHQIKIGYRLIETYWGHGIATATVKLMSDYIFYNTDIEIISASNMIGNLASEKVLKKCGFTLVDTNIVENWGFAYPILANRWKLHKHDYQR